ncbi:MAG: hypothetical protein PHX70_10000 [Clostridium sp.]|nr:hypothetical protein [Clostridium sp.]
MKASKRILVWIIVSLIFQFSVYLFLENVYYAKEGDIKIKDISTSNKQKKIAPNVVFDNNTKDISLSDDLSYTAYLGNGYICVVDTNTGKPRKIKYSNEIQCLSYKWVPSTDVIIIAEKLNAREIRFYSYDAVKQTKVEIDEKLKINSVPAGKTVDMQIADLTGLLYIKVGYTKNQYNIYRMDKNETLTRVRLHNGIRNIGKIALASDDDQLAYEDLVYGRIRTNYSPKPYIIIQGVYRPSIIGTDKSDNFYIGNGIKQSNKIYYGNLTNNTSHWNVISLGKMINNTSIVIKQSGGVYIVDRQNSIVTDVKTNKIYRYQGSYCEINSGYIVYTSNKKLKIKQMK